MHTCWENPILADAKRIKPQINLSPQETAVAPNLSIAENLRLIAGIYGQTVRQAKASAQQALDEFGLTAVATQKAHTLSGGMQRRLSIAMGLITNPKILFLDEPTVGLDVFARRELWNVIKGLKGQVTILLTTHYLEEVEALADRIAIMVTGRIIAVGTLAELKKQSGEDSLEDAFVKLAGGNNELA